MSKILFMDQIGAGPTNILLDIALEMRRTGDEVRFLVPGLKPPFDKLPGSTPTKAAPDLLTTHGVPFDILDLPVSVVVKGLLLRGATGYMETLGAIEVFLAGLSHYVRDALANMARFKPDVVVSTFSFAAAELAAEAAGTPSVVVYESGLPFSGRDVPPFGSGLPIGDTEHRGWAKYQVLDKISSWRIRSRLAAVRQKLGLPPCDREPLRHPSSPWLNLVPSIEAIEAPRDDLGPSTLFIGPCFGNRKHEDANFPYHKLQSDKYKIYVSLGTIFDDRPLLFEKIIRALSGPEYQLIVSAGASYNALCGRVESDRVLLFRRVPQVDLLPHVDMVIGHGGNNSVNETLAAGKPMLVIPIGGEQGDNARRVEYLKAGLRLNLHGLTAEAVHQKANQIRATPSFAERAEQLKKRIAETCGDVTAARCIEWIALHHRPLRRPPGFPVTITKENLSALLAS